MYAPRSEYIEGSGYEARAPESATRVAGDPGRYALALASRPPVEDKQGGAERWTLVEILGGGETPEDLERAMARARNRESIEVGLDVAVAPLLPAGEGASDEISEQRAGRLRV